MKGIWVTIITCGLILSTLAPESSAQISGSVVGTVQDSTGAVVPNVAVTLTNTATNIVQTTVTTSSVPTIVQVFGLSGERFATLKRNMHHLEKEGA